MSSIQLSWDGGPCKYPGTLLAVDTLASPLDLIALAKEAEGRKGDGRFEAIGTLFSSREVLVASFGRVAASAATSGRDEGASQVFLAS
jgi:hypothetical protein